MTKIERDLLEAKGENLALQTQNTILVETVKDMFEYLVDDTELLEIIPQDKWDRWQDIVDERPIQLRLF
tara:strand:+ start:626 stop:832 length:207 start_codon:yes stop_codon:yes gene_type:complete